jgi:hypothetical protein
MTSPIHDSDRPTRPLAASSPFPPMPLSRRAHAALIGLRLLICLTTAMAIFTIVHAQAH